MAEKPRAAFALSLIGAVIILLGGLAMLIQGAMNGNALLFAGLGDFGVGYAVGVLGLIWGIIALYGAIMMNSSDKSKVRTGAILVLVFSIISFFGALAGFYIGFILGLIGAILGLIWKPSATAEKPQPTATPPTPPVAP